jgi:hypothetical protein
MIHDIFRAVSWTNLREALPFAQNAANGYLEHIQFLSMQISTGLTDLQGQHSGDHLAEIGRISFHVQFALPAMYELFGLFGRVSRQPHAIFWFTATSTTEYVLRFGHHLAVSVDAAFRDRTIRQPEISGEERGILHRFWRSSFETFRQNRLLLPYTRCNELKAEVDWECHRVADLLPPEEKKVMPARGTVEMFFSYSHKDEKLRDKLVNHLAQLKNEGILRDWHDRKISAGIEWHGQINGHLNSAHIILLLVSSDFLASQYIHDVEVKRAMERHEAGEARVIPVILRPCDWHSARFGKLQALPTDGKPITKWDNRDEAFTVVAKGIRATVKEIVEAGKAGA